MLLLFDRKCIVDNNTNYIGTYDIEIGIAILTHELELQGYSSEDCLDGNPCIVLW